MTSTINRNILIGVLFLKVTQPQKKTENYHFDRCLILLIYLTRRCRCAPRPKNAKPEDPLENLSHMPWHAPHLDASRGRALACVL